MAPLCPDVARHLPAAVDRGFGGFQPHGLEPGPLAGRLHAFPAARGHPGLRRPGNKGNLAVAVGGQAADCLADALVDVGNHARHALDLAVDDHHRFVAGEGADVVIVHARAGQDEAVHGGHHPACCRQLGDGGLGRLGQHQGVVPQRGGGFRPADDVEKRGVGDVRDDQAEGVGPAGGQRAGERVDLVVQLGGRVLDEFLRLGADPARLAERPGNRGRIDAGNLGDVVDGGVGLSVPGVLFGRGLVWRRRPASWVQSPPHPNEETTQPGSQQGPF